MKTYIITFFSHFGATRFKKEMKKAGTEVQLKPVPRFLSSSCGTCAIAVTEDLTFPENIEEVEQIVVLKSDFSSGNSEYETLYSAIEG